MLIENELNRPGKIVGLIMQDKQKVFITGANGFVGSAVVEAMFLSNVFTPIAGVSSFSRAAKVGRMLIEIRLADVLNKSILYESFKDVDVVVHCAAGSEETIVNGTENVMSVAKELGIKKIVHISTVDVYGNVSGVVDESFPLKSKGFDYSEWKIRAEKICQKYIEKELPITILRPAIIYGPYSKLWTLRFAERLKTGHLANLGEKGEGKCNLIYINDLVGAIFKVIPNNGSDNKAYNIIGNEIITWNEYFVKLSSNLGIENIETQNSIIISIKNLFLNPLRSFAKFLLSQFKDSIMKVYAKYPLANKVIKIFEKMLKGNPDSNEMGLYKNDVIFENKKAKRDFDFVPTINSNKGVLECIKWLNTIS